MCLTAHKTQGLHLRSSQPTLAHNTNQTQHHHNMRLPTTLRRSKPDLETSPSQRGLGKWEDLARADSSSDALVRPSGHNARPKRSGEVCSPRWIDDKATPGIQRYRTGAQLAAFAAVCDVHPLLLL
jgi:hypothetical protein